MPTTPTRRHRRGRALLAALLSLLLIAAACADDGAFTTDEGGGRDTAADDAPDAEVAAEPDDAPADSDGDDAMADEGDADESAAASTDAFDSDTLEAARGVVDLGADGQVLAETPQEAPDETQEPSDPTDPGEGLAVPTDLTSLVLGRDIIYTSELEIGVADVEAATTAALDAIAGIGLVFGQQSTTDPAPRTVLTIKVRPEDFAEALVRLKQGVGGKVERETVSTDDVTERVVDLESRITTAESSVERIRALLDDARDLDTIRNLEEQLLERETVLEVLRGQLKTLQEQVALATITLTITQRSAGELEAGLELTSWLGVSPDEACPGSSELEVGADDDAVLCIEIENTGDDVLTEIDIDVPTFNLRIDDLTFRDDGSPESVEPGDALTAVVVLTAEDGFVRRRDIRSGSNVEIVVTAVPAGDPGGLLQADDILFLSAEQDDDLPGFGDSLESGWGAFTTVVGVILIAVGLLLPFLPFIALFVWLVRRSHLRGLERSYPSISPESESET